MLARRWNKAEIELIERHANDWEKRRPKLEVALTEGAKADWFLLRTMPGEDVKAMRWLARRGFGVFRPMQLREDKREMEPIFPGRLFVYVWNIDAMQARLVSCPGITGIMHDPVTLKPIRVNQRDEEGVYFIDRLRALDLAVENHKPKAFSESAKKVKRVKLDKRQKKTLHKLKKSAKEQRNFDSSTWKRINELAPHERIALLRNTLLAAPQGTSSPNR